MPIMIFKAVFSGQTKKRRYPNITKFITVDTSNGPDLQLLVNRVQTQLEKEGLELVELEDIERIG